MKGLTCCVTTTWNLKMNENVWCLGNGSCKFVSSQRMRVSFVVAISFSFKFKIKVEEEAYNPEKGNDKEKLWMVFERMANKIWMAPFSSVRGRLKLAGSMETTKFAWKSGRKFPTSLGNWGRC